jgi:hypothetical protein
MSFMMPNYYYKEILYYPKKNKQHFLNCYSKRTKITKMFRKKYDIAIATRNFEIELFWKRALFFWGFIALTFAGYASSISCDKCNDNNFYPLLIACFGFI